MSRGEVRSQRVANYEGMNEQQRLLNHAAERLLELGRRTGVTPDQIAAMLNSGIKLEELVRQLAIRLHGCDDASHDS